jgi:hypothetical protein
LRTSTGNSTAFVTRCISSISSTHPETTHFPPCEDCPSWRVSRNSVLKARTAKLLTGIGTRLLAERNIANRRSSLQLRYSSEFGHQKACYWRTEFEIIHWYHGYWIGFWDEANIPLEFTASVVRPDSLSLGFDSWR